MQVRWGWLDASLKMGCMCQGWVREAHAMPAQHITAGADVSQQHVATPQLALTQHALVEFQAAL
jgi:hypothetical protein